MTIALASWIFPSHILWALMTLIMSIRNSGTPFDFVIPSPSKTLESSSTSIRLSKSLSSSSPVLRESCKNVIDYLIDNIVK